MVGHWLLPENQEYVPECHVCFTYEVNLPEISKKYIGFKSIKSRKSGKETNWKWYKTSSKLVKKYLKQGFVAEFKIIEFFENYEKGYAAETDLLKAADVLGVNKNLYLNQCITHDRMLRLPESYTDEAVNSAREGLRAWMESEDYVHPMQGKKHPNKGKKLPQTAPKVHVSVNNVQITNGEVNRWWDKNKPLPEGFRYGWVTQRRDLSPDERERLQQRLRGYCEIRSKEARENYYADPNLCVVCQSVIPYEYRFSNKTCSAACRSKNRSKISSSYEVSEDERIRRSLRQKQKMADKFGFDTYDQLCDTIIELCKTAKVRDVAENFGISPTGINGCFKHKGFSLREYRKIVKLEELND